MVARHDYGSKTRAQREKSDMVHRVGAVADETVLIEIADLPRHRLPERRRNADEVAHAVNAGSLLEAVLVEVDEGLVAEIERGLPVQWESQLGIGPEAPAGAVNPVAPA